MRSTAQARQLAAIYAAVSAPGVARAIAAYTLLLQGIPAPRALTPKLHLPTPPLSINAHPQGSTFA